MSLYSPHKGIANQARGQRTSVGDQLSACWSHRVQEDRCDRGCCRHSRGPVAWSSASETTEAGAAGAAEEAAAEAAAKEAEKAAEATDGAPVRKPERRSVPAAARPSLLAQPLGSVVAL